MEEKVSGIVLSGVNFGENDRILTIFTLEQGVISARIKGVKKAGAKLKFAQEPFCFAEFILAKTGKNRTVINASLIDSFYPVRENIRKYYAGATVLEFVKKFSAEGIVCADLFMLTISTLKKIAYADFALSELVRFLLQALKLSGYALNLEGCFNCGCDFCGEKLKRIYFDYLFGGFFCEECHESSAREIKNSTYSALKTLSQGGGVDENDCIGALRLLDFYILNKTEEKINSLKELIKII